MGVSVSVSVGGWVYIRIYVGVGVLVKVPAVCCCAVHTYVMSVQYMVMCFPLSSLFLVLTLKYSEGFCVARLLNYNDQKLH